MGFSCFQRCIMYMSYIRYIPDHELASPHKTGITYVLFISDFTLFPVHLVQGYRYYSTIMACNTADLCSSVTSDGVIIDSSPPTVGVVQDGVEVYDTHYQSMRYICL